MNPKRIIKLSNIIGIVSILLLVYWVFTFILINVFGLKVFRENITESFYLSILGILALMLGSLIINIMFNLTRIAEKHNQDGPGKPDRKKMLALIAVFPLIAVLLFCGDYLTAKKKENLLIDSAKSIVENNQATADKLAGYSFTDAYISQTEKILEVYAQTDKHFPHVTVLVNDTIDGNTVFLGFSNYSNENLNDTIQPAKVNYIHKTDKTEREYLLKVFKGESTEIKYTAQDGNYELFYPYEKDKKRIVLHFSDYQRYGKIGS